MACTIKALVLGVGGNVSQGIIKALRESSLPVKIIGACISEYSKGLYMCDEGYICPYTVDEQFVPWVIDFCNANSIDIIFTGVEETILKLSKYRDEIKRKTKAVFICSGQKQLLIGQDKYLTCQFLQESGCNYPAYHLWNSIEDAIIFAEKVGYPIIAKPRNGKGSLGIHILNSPEEIREHDNLKGYVLEEVVGDSENEFTVGCYVDKEENLQCVFPMRRKLKNGTTVWAQTVDNQIIVDECVKICKSFKPKGPLNIQLRTDRNGRPVCFELNVRFSGTTAIRSHFGFQDVKAMIKEYVYDEDVSDCFNIRSGEVFRFDEELYLTKNATDAMRRNNGIRDIREVQYSSEV